jgi:phosphoribosylformimino-5-aminoimidazole carboxamide ribotide isomerase
MQIWPAIDLRGGKCVRLEQGDYKRETVFGDDPATMARHWVDQGAECLHLVDLDGALSGHVENRASIAAIVKAVSVPCELGGGVRDLETIADLFELGIARLVVGTKALKEPEWFREVCRRYPGRMVLGIDALNGRVATDGWQKASEVSATRLAHDLSREPIAAIVYTDIATDGMMSGPNLTALDELRRAVAVPLIASGGVTNVTDVAQLAQLGMAGCIIGRSLYEGRLSLVDALEAAREYSRG